LWTGKRSIVYVKNKQGENNITFEFREIETGDMTEAGYIVLSGLSEGEEIAVNGVFAIDASAQLRGHYSMMSPPEKIIIPENFKTNLKGIFDEYFKIKNALADDNPQSAQNYAKNFKKQLEKTGQHSLDGEHHMFWMQQYEAMESSTAKFLKADNKETMRMHFEPLSKTMIETARTLGAIGQTFYVAFCPMYDNDRGAYWLSEFKEIKNPYFGSMMLRCGEVRETIREGISAESSQQPREVEGHVH
jgi:membrane fusion protein, copper/silver efflux system